MEGVNAGTLWCQFLEAKGLIHTSPGQRPGYWEQTPVQAESLPHSFV